MYDLFVTKINQNNIVKEYSIYEEKYNINIDCIVHLKVECEDLIDYYNNYKLANGELIELTEEEKQGLIEPVTPDKMSILEGKVEAVELENATQSLDITLNNDMIFMALDATAELNESNIANTDMVLISMDALTEINEQIIALQDQINVLKGVK